MNFLKFIGMAVIEAATLVAQAPCAVGEVLCIGGRDVSKGIKKAAEFSEVSFEKGRVKCASGRSWIRTESEFKKVLLQLKIAKTPEEIFSVISEEEVDSIMAVKEEDITPHDKKLRAVLLSKTQKFTQTAQPA